MLFLFFFFKACFLDLHSIRKLEETIISKIQLFYQKLKKGKVPPFCVLQVLKKPCVFLAVSVLPVQERPVLETEGGGQEKPRTHTRAYSEHRRQFLPDLAPFLALSSC